MYSVVTICNSRAMKSGNTSELRKGAWSYDEDTLLRKCIEKYGEGKWHLVPQRAGLNRCRKSCRLRWLNYLRPTIRRGEFSADEMDLMIRLHRLLGNRWSLIGGRLPGRTANDVKNFWNTNVQKKLATVKEMGKTEEHFPRKQESNINAPTTAGGTATMVIKPLPRTLSKGERLACYNHNPTDHMIFGSPEKTLYYNNNNNNNNNKLSSQATLMETLPPSDDVGIEWWKNLFAEIDNHGKEQDSLEGAKIATSSGSENMDGDRGLIWETGESTAPATEANYGLPEDDWSDIWDFINPSDDN